MFFENNVSLTKCIALLYDNNGEFSFVDIAGIDVTTTSHYKDRVNSDTDHIKLYEWDDDTIDKLRRNGGSITIDGSTHDITQINTNDEITQYYVHFDISGGDGNDPIGIYSDGSNSASITVTIRESEDPSSNIITDINETWRVSIRKEDTREVVDVIGVSFTNGQATFNYSAPPTGICGVYYVDDEDIYKEYEISQDNWVSFNLVDIPQIKVYRNVS